MNLKTEIISEDLKKEFQEVYKRGIYKELHKRNFLSDKQLNELLKSK
jgi:hypothetical protein